MQVLIIKNIFTEGPGTIADYLHAEKIPSTLCDLSTGDAVPDLGPFTHLVIMGGPMAVYEMDRYPYLKNEVQLISAAIKANKHVLGVCLGAQMVAHALGARVYAGEQKEIGWYEVSITPEGMKDPLMSSLALDGKSLAQVFQWHGDTFDLPANAVRLASSDLYHNQAFRYSDRVYALQFHIEVTPAIVRDWLVPEQGIDTAAICMDSERIYGAYRDRAEKFYTR
ncbi:MAG TPA: type 1 glutamine amidotransferase, partial [Nitrospirota bacterium]|nr:type 1 glutamine amidotransferase [Nitrospirota bacterium]